MKIVTRHKNSNGDITGYTVDIDGRKEFISHDKMVEIMTKNQNIVVNARLGNNKIVGNNIDTSVELAGIKVSRFSQSNKDIDVEDSLDFPVDYYGAKYIKICKEFRKYAFCRNISIDTNKHSKNGGANKHLFELIKSCGISVTEFVAGYLSVIQPYSLEPFQGAKDISNETWVCDVGYRVKMVIKIRHSNPKAPLVVSFHESNIHGNGCLGTNNFSDKLCAVIIKDCKKLDNSYAVSFFVQKGFIRHKFTARTKYVKKGVALINYSSINSDFEWTMNNILNELKQSYSTYSGDATRAEIENKSIINFSFMSFGYASANNIYYLLDLYGKFTDNKSRSFISEIASNLIKEMTPNKRIELKKALEEKFEVNKGNNKLTDNKYNALSKNTYTNALYIEIKKLLS